MRKKLVSVTVSGGVSILTALVAHWDAGVSRSVSQCLVSTKYSRVGALNKGAVYIYYDQLYFFSLPFLCLFHCHHCDT